MLIGPDGTQVTLFLNQVNSAGAANTNIGITGANMGIAPSGQAIGTTFNDNAARSIVDRSAAAPYIGTFRPEVGSLASFESLPLSSLNGTWTLQITDFRNSGSPPPPESVQSWSLTLNSGVGDQTDSQVVTTTVRGNFTGNFALASATTPNGIGPGVVVASDNTLGSFSPHEGRLYVAYVDRATFDTGNQADNTDIYLAVSDDGGQSWQSLTSSGFESFFGSVDASNLLPVNSDAAATDGYSGSINQNDPTNETGIIRGRTQFMPAVAVDQATGTLVMSWRDARDDAADARVATYVTASIDGGATYNTQVYANPPATAVDAITGQTVTIGPESDNESTGNTSHPNTDTLFGYGNKMGLAVYAGHVYPAWSSNFNGPNVTPNANSGAPLNIEVNPMTIAAGPRVVSSTMGPVGGPGDTLNVSVGPDGTPKPTTFQVVFDRPIDPLADAANNTFTPDKVGVFYHDTNAGSAFVPLLVTAVKPVSTPGDPNNDGHFGYTTWLVTFDPTKNASGAASGITNFTGTFSYYIKPEVSDRIRSYQVLQTTQPPVNQGSQDTPVTIPQSGSGGTGSGNDFAFSEINTTKYTGQVITNVNVTLSISVPNGATLKNGALIITLFYESADGTTFTPITLYEKSSDTGSGFNNTTFSDAAPLSINSPSAVAPYSGSYRPQQPLSALKGQPVNGFWFLEIDDTQAGNIGTLNSWSLTINSTKTASTATLSTGNMMDQNGNAVKGEDPTVAPVVGTTPGDLYAAPSPMQPANQPTTYDLTPGSGNLFPQGPYDQNTLPLIVSGPHVVSTDAGSPVTAGTPGPQGTADNLVLNAKNSILDVTFDRDMNPASFTPAQVLQIMGPAGRIDGPQTFTLPSTSQNQTIPAGTGVPLSSTITIPNDNNTFPISNLAVQVNITHPADQALTAYLVAPNGNKIQLFTGVGGIGGANFTNTVFSDSAATSITAGVAPFTGTYRPIGSLNSLIHPNGLNNPPIDLQGTWTLQVLDSQKRTTPGTLVSWSLIATPQISVTPKMDGKTAGTSRTFTIGFPQQQLSGTYTVQLASSITSAAGQPLDQNQNAGVDVLRGEGTNVPTTPITYTATGLPKSIPDGGTVPNPGGGTSPATLTSTINVPDNFPIQGVTAAGLSGLTVTVNIQHPSDSDLTAVLVYHPGQPDEVDIPLFAHVGSGPNAANFSNTTFDDLSTTPIQSGGAPSSAPTPRWRRCSARRC